MKKLLTSLLCVMMVVCFMPAMAFADADADTDDSAVVAKIGENTYSTLGEAINGASDGDTIILQSDVTIDDNSCNDTSSNGEKRLSIKSNITLDLGGHTLYIDNKNAYGIYIDAFGETVRIQNGIIDDISGNNSDVNKSYTIYLYDGTLETKDLTIKTRNPLYNTYSYSIYIYNKSGDAAATLGSGTSIVEVARNYEDAPTVDHEQGYYGVVGVAAYGYYKTAEWNNLEDKAAAKRTALTIEAGASIEVNEYAVSTNGSYHPTDITINGGTLTSKLSTGIYFPGDGELTINDGTITGQAAGIELRAGTLNMNGGTVTALAAPTASQANGNGTSVSGTAIAVSQHTTNLDIDVNINGGTLTGYIPLYEEDLQDTAIDNISLSVTGGTFISQGEAEEGSAAESCVIYSENCPQFVTGGVYSDLVNNAYIADNMTSVSVESSGETRYYIGEDETLADTLEEILASGDTVTVLQGSLEMTGVVNNVTVTNSKDNTETVTVNGTSVEAGGEPVVTYTYVYIPTIPTVQKPVIEPNADVTTSLSTDGTTLTIKANDGYEITDVTVNGVSKGAVTTLTGLKTGDKIVITTKKIETPDDNAALIEAVKNTKLIARSAMSTAKGKKAVKVSWYAADGSDLDFDGYEVFRSLKRYSGFGTTPIFKTANEKYYNTAIKKGNKYYYKVRAYKVIDGEKVYTDWSTKAWRTVK